MNTFKSIIWFFLAILFVSCETSIYEPDLNLPVENNDIGEFEFKNIISTNNQIYLSWTGAVNAESYDILVNDTLSVSKITTNSFTINGLNPESEYKVSVRAFNKHNFVKIISLKIRTMKEHVSEIIKINFGKYEYSDYTFVSCKKTSDNGFLFVGQIGKYGKGYNLILKTDQNFNVIWKFESEDIHNTFHYMFSVEQSIEECSNGNFVIKLDKSIYKINSYGTLLWKIPMFDDLNYVNETSDGNYLAVGKSTELNSPKISINFKVIKFSNDGSIVWKKAFGNTYYNYGFFAVPNKDGSFLLIGTVETTGVTSENYYVDKNGLSIHKMSADGELLSENVFPYNGTVIPHFVIPTTDNENFYFVCSGVHTKYNQTSENYIVKTKNDGTFLWEKRGSDYGEYYSSPSAARLLTNNDLLVLSYVDNGNYEIKEYNSEGDIKSKLLLRKYPRPILIDKDENERYIYVTHDGYIIKINPDGYVKP